MVHTYCMTADMLSKNVTKGNARVRKDSLCVQPLTGAIKTNTIDNLN